MAPGRASGLEPARIGGACAIGPELALYGPMALFNRDRDGGDRSTEAVPAGPRTDTTAPREDGMSGTTSQMGGTGGIDAFLGKGTKVSGKLTFEGPGRIEGQVDGEVTAQDTLTIGQGAIVKAKITGT